VGPVAANSFGLKGVSAKEVAKGTWASVRADDVFGRSAQLAYYFFLALFPFLIFVIASLSIVGEADRGRELLFGFFVRFLPPQAFQLITHTFSEILQSSGPLKMSFGILASLWSASMGMSAIMDTLNAAYNVRETRSLTRQYAVAIGLTFGIALWLVISIVAVIVGNTLAGEPSGGNVVATSWRIVLWPVVLAGCLSALALIYHFAPNLANRRWQWISPGAIAALLLLALASIGLRAYLRFAVSYSVAYGSLGAVIVLLLWFYVGGVAVLSGGVLNGVLEVLSARAGNPKERRRNKVASSLS
jgi:membrane protein